MLSACRVLAGQEPSLRRPDFIFVRLPRILFAGVVGASLSVSGVVFQAILRNPLADPFVLGISGGSALGAIVAIVIGASAFYLGLPFLAFAGALATVFLVFIVAGGPRGVLLDNSLLLAGVVVNSFFSAAILFALSVVDSLELHSISFWLMGDLSRASLAEIGGSALCLGVCFVLLYAQARKLNLIVQGEETALQLGVNVRATKYILLAVTSLVIAVAVSFAGIIGSSASMVRTLMRLVSVPITGLAPARRRALRRFLPVAATRRRAPCWRLRSCPWASHRALRRSLFHFPHAKEGAPMTRFSARTT